MRNSLTIRVGKEVTQPMDLILIFTLFGETFFSFRFEKKNNLLWSQKNIDFNLIDLFNTQHKVYI